MKFLCLKIIKIMYALCSCHISFAILKVKYCMRIGISHEFEGLMSRERKPGVNDPKSDTNWTVQPQMVRPLEA